MILMAGFAAGYTVWQRLGPAAGKGAPGEMTHASLVVVSAALRLVLALLTVLLALVVAFARYHGRTIEQWMLAMLHYASVPKTYVWRSLPIASRESLQHTLLDEEQRLAARTITSGALRAHRTASATSAKTTGLEELDLMGWKEGGGR